MQSPFLPLRFGDFGATINEVAYSAAFGLPIWNNGFTVCVLFARPVCVCLFRFLGAARAGMLFLQAKKSST
jgi:hypothetical protein